MRKVIGRKVYNTETATLVASDERGYSGDLNEINEYLYVTRGGAWFLHGNGGAASRYAKVGDSDGWWTAGEDISLFTADEARAWLETRNEIDAIEHWFGPAAEAEAGVANYALRLPGPLKARAAKAAEGAGVSLNRWIENAIAARLDDAAEPSPTG